MKNTHGIFLKVLVNSDMLKFNGVFMYIKVCISV